MNPPQDFADKAAEEIQATLLGSAVYNSGVHRIAAIIRRHAGDVAKLREQCQKIWEQTTANPYGQLFQIQHALAMLLSGLSGLASTPAPETVNQRLLKAAKDILIHLRERTHPEGNARQVSYTDDVVCSIRSFDALEAAVDAAESLPPSMEAELAAALKAMRSPMTATIPNEHFAFKTQNQVDAACNWADAVLARYEQRKAE